MTLPAPTVHLDGLRFGWGERVTLDIPELTIAAGEHVFVVGPSGCGKSTLLGLVGGVSTPRDGTVSVLGQDIGALSQSHRDRFRGDHIGIMFQLFNLVPYLSMTDNVALPCRFSAIRRSKSASAGAGIAAEADRLLSALGLTDRGLRRRPVTELSIGQQQRVAAARALMGSPELLIADEPTSALDEGTRQQFLELLFLECKRAGTTLIFVSH
ncbi:MAG: ATP-binding cassette domain-containing protein, partial [Chromatiales bacterium]|nr:ATP-binding cassette domain-containing protein [Chromatiales bacterium]